MNHKSNNDLEVVVSHPAKQGMIYQIPLAIQRQCIPVKFLTGLYYKPQLYPYSLVRFLPPSKRASVVRQLEKRRLLELDPESVISLGGPWLEAAFRPLSLFRQWHTLYDWLASRWIRRLTIPPKRVFLHCFDGSALWTMQAAKRRGITTVYEITLPVIVADLFEKEQNRLGFSGNKQRKWWSTKNWVKRLVEEYRTADYIVAQSRVTVECLLQLDVPPSKIILLPLGVDTVRFQPAPKHDVNRPFRALFVGQIGIRKGVQHLLEAWKELNLPQAELVLAGSINKDEFGDRILEQYRNCYRWLGFVDTQLPEVYQSSDVFVLPSLAEGTSLAMHEAMASGLPCIVTTNVGCTLRDGIEGFIVQVGDVEALKERILQLYSDVEMRRKMSVAARMRAEELTWEKYGRRLAFMYREIYSDARSSARGILDMSELSI